MIDMKVVILCGGLGTRLKEETEYHPKPMVKIGGRPILWHIMKIYSHYNYNDFILCLGYKGDMIKEYFYHYRILNSDFTIDMYDNKIEEIREIQDEKNWKVTLVNTGDRAPKGTRLKRIEKYIDSDTFMVTYGDGLANININNLIDFHMKKGKIATVTGVYPPSRFGTLMVEGDRVIRFSEKSQAFEGIINGGFFVFNRKIFDYLRDDDLCDLENGVLDELAKIDELSVYRHTGEWACMDTIRDMEYLNDLCSSGRPFWKLE